MYNPLVKGVFFRPCRCNQVSEERHLHFKCKFLGFTFNPNNFIQRILKYFVEQ